VCGKGRDQGGGLPLRHDLGWGGGVGVCVWRGGKGRVWRGLGLWGGG
jgi:hypothetical protein